MSADERQNPTRGARHRDRLVLDPSGRGCHADHVSPNPREDQAHDLRGSGETRAARGSRARAARPKHHGVLQGFQREDCRLHTGRAHPRGDHRVQGQVLRVGNEIAARDVLREKSRRRWGGRAAPGTRGQGHGVVETRVPHRQGEGAGCWKFALAETALPRRHRHGEIGRDTRGAIVQ